MQNKNRIVFFLVLALCILNNINAQNTGFKITANIQPQINHPFFDLKDSIYNPLTLVFTDENGVTHYDNIPDSNKYAVTANCTTNSEVTEVIHFANAGIQNDTLIITISEGNAAETQTISCWLYKKKGKAYYYYSTPAMGSGTSIVIDCSLILDKETYKIGDKLKGHITIRAKCSKNCSGNLFEAKGYFKCTVVEISKPLKFEE